MWEGKHFHKYNKYLFWSKSKVRCRVFYLNKNNLQNNALNINKSISGQHSKINMNTLIYVLFLAAKVINLLANATASQKSCILGLVLCLTWERFIGSGKWHYSCMGFSSAHLCQTGFGQDLFSICVLNTDLENSFHKKKNKNNKKKKKSGSTQFLMLTGEFGLAWTLMILVRCSVFSLQSTVFYAGGRVGRSQTIKQCWRGRGKLWSLVGKGHNRAVGQGESRLPLPARNTFPPCPTLVAWVPLSALYLL